jgi:Calcineurin-like phosphoesterase
MSNLQKKINRTIGLIVPDVHEKIQKLKLILRFYKHVDWVVFLGDFMDSWDGLTWETWEMIKWLHENLDNPKYTFLWGNHDLGYPFSHIFECSGFDPKKLEIIRQYIDDKQWNKFKLVHWIGPFGEQDPGNSIEPQEWMISHAGLHPYFLHPFHGFDKAWMADKAEETIYKIKYENTITEWLACGRRCGFRGVGGLVWLDWSTEFQPIEGLNQIVGHSYSPDVRIKNGVNSKNYCLDTGLNHVIEVREDGTLKVVKVKF